MCCKVYQELALGVFNIHESILTNIVTIASNYHSLSHFLQMFVLSSYYHSTPSGLLRVAVSGSGQHIFSQYCVCFDILLFLGSSDLRRTQALGGRVRNRAWVDNLETVSINDTEAENDGHIDIGMLTKLLLFAVIQHVARPRY